MKNKTIYSLLVLIVLVLLGGFLISKNKSVGPSADHKIALGVIAPMSGPSGSMGEYVKKAIELADSNNLNLLYQDDECDAKKAVSAYQQLKLQNVKVFYMACSGSVLSVAPLAKQNGDLILTAYAGSAKIRKTGDEVIRFIPDALTIVDAMKEYFASDSSNSYALLFENQDYAKSVADGVESALSSRLLVKESYASDAADVRTQLAKINAANIDRIVLIPVSDKTAQIVLKQMKDAGIKATIVGDVNLCEYPFSPADYGLHTVCWKAALNEDQANKFDALYKNKYGTPSQYAFYDAVTYDSIKILDSIIKDTPKGESMISEIKSKILAGVKGDITSYTFDSNGEVQGIKYLKKVEK